MKKYIIAISLAVIIFISADFAYYHMGIHVDLDKNQNIECFMTTDEEKIYMNNIPFEIKGVDLLSVIPGKKDSDFAIDKETYLRWFSDIQNMGANTIRIYTIQDDAFYNAFYEYNINNSNPLYLLHGIVVDDYVQNSRFDAFDEKFFSSFLNDSIKMVDVIHGKRKLFWGEVKNSGHGMYFKDISKWVIGYILGSEWKDGTVAYTDDLYDNQGTYSGEYMYAKKDASPFESMLAKIGDAVISYESERYNQQRLIAFTNGPKTDPFDYPKETEIDFEKCAFIDVEHIKTTDKFKSGHFASYHVYPYYPDYLKSLSDWTQFGIDAQDIFKDSDGKINTYKAYLTMLTKHHSIPVVISEFGLSSSRGVVLKDEDLGRKYGNMSEKEQAEALLSCYNDIVDSGCAGACIYAWQDDWSKKTWNTLYSINSSRTQYWSDYQSAKGYFGLISFDPGTEKSISYADGDIREWTETDVVAETEDVQLSLKYDEKFIYLFVNKNNFDYEKEKLYIPIDITQKTGSKYCEKFNINFDRNVDFLVVIDGKDNSNILVNSRYESLRSTYAREAYNINAYDISKIPAHDSSGFVPVNMILQNKSKIIFGKKYPLFKTFETGKLIYGNTNPESEEFNSLGDYYINNDFIEIRLPWQILNFSDPSKMMIHDDYYDGNYGIKHIKIDELYIGVCDGINDDAVKLSPARLSGWGNNVTYHERFKSSYYAMKDIWNNKNE